MGVLELRESIVLRLIVLWLLLIRIVDLIAAYVGASVIGGIIASFLYLPALWSFGWQAAKVKNIGINRFFLLLVGLAFLDRWLLGLLFAFLKAMPSGSVEFDFLDVSGALLRHMPLSLVAGTLFAGVPYFIRRSRSSGSSSSQEKENP